jgi:hypothetical protein
MEFQMTGFFDLTSVSMTFSCALCLRTLFFSPKFSCLVIENRLPSSEAQIANGVPFLGF